MAAAEAKRRSMGQTRLCRAQATYPGRTHCPVPSTRLFCAPITSRHVGRSSPSAETSRPASLDDLDELLVLVWILDEPPKQPTRQCSAGSDIPDILHGPRPRRRPGQVCPASCPADLDTDTGPAFQTLSRRPAPSPAAVWLLRWSINQQQSPGYWNLVASTILRASPSATRASLLLHQFSPCQLCAVRCTIRRCTL